MSAELQQLRAAVQRDPGDFVAWLLLGDREMDLGALGAAEQALQRALALRPDHPEALARLGRLRWLQARHDEAAGLLQKAARLAPDHPGIALWLGHALEDSGAAEAAAEAYRHAHRLLPTQPYIAAQLLNWCRRLCDWPGLETLSRQVRDAVTRAQPGVEPFAFLSEDATPAEQLACARLRAQSLARTIPALPPAPAPAPGPLRVGFLSNGFGAHPTGVLTVALFEALARRHRADLQLHLFALNADDGSRIRRRLDAATTIHDLSRIDHPSAANVIRAQQIQLLFDLRGWGGGGAPELLARRPAPIQLNWLAYPGSSGAPWIDYAIGDAFALPPALEPHYSERVLRLPRAFQPSDNQREVAEPPPRHDCGLPHAGFVFCCFNNSYKLNPRSVGRMLTILGAVDDSVLWLLSGPGRADARLRAAAQARGVAPQRLVFMPKLPHPQYLARYRHAGLFLDCHPYNAHTTASDALWAGCPVLTMPGATFASRVAGSLNHHLGLDDMNVADDDAFIARAIHLARTPAALQALRQRLYLARQRAGGLFDMAAFADDFAILLRRLADRAN